MCNLRGRGSKLHERRDALSLAANIMNVTSPRRGERGLSGAKQQSQVNASIQVNSSGSGMEAQRQEAEARRISGEGISCVTWRFNRSQAIAALIETMPSQIHFTLSTVRTHSVVYWIHIITKKRAFSPSACRTREGSSVTWSLCTSAFRE